MSRHCVTVLIFSCRSRGAGRSCVRPGLATTTGQGTVPSMVDEKRKADDVPICFDLHVGDPAGAHIDAHVDANKYY
ncbi:hypothetical protein LZ32DRAFT_373171 [Colletotrichum eremochloae]|nr:hypothetical protein LZ32DRAFT_373171 [Colletotrichum eremochloae]